MARSAGKVTDRSSRIFDPTTHASIVACWRILPRFQIGHAGIEWRNSQLPDCTAYGRHCETFLNSVQRELILSVSSNAPMHCKHFKLQNVRPMEGFHHSVSWHGASEWVSGLGHPYPQLQNRPVGIWPPSPFGAFGLTPRIPRWILVLERLRHLPWKLVSESQQCRRVDACYPDSLAFNRRSDVSQGREELYES